MNTALSSKPGGMLPFTLSVSGNDKSMITHLSEDPLLGLVIIGLALLQGVNGGSCNGPISAPYCSSLARYLFTASGKCVADEWLSGHCAGGSVPVNPIGKP